MPEDNHRLVVKDILLFSFGAIIGSISPGIGFPNSIFVVVFSGLILLFVITEISGSPIWKLYNFKVVFKSNSKSEQIWRTLEDPDDIISTLLLLIENYRSRFSRRMNLGDFSNEKSIIIASYNINLLEKFLEILKESKPDKIYGPNKFSTLKHLLRIEKNSWNCSSYISTPIKYFGIKRQTISLTSSRNQIREIFDILLNKIKSLQELPNSKKIKNGYRFSNNKRYARIVLDVKNIGSNIILDLVYGEIESVEIYSNNEPKELYDISSKVDKKFDDVLKKIKNDKIEYQIEDRYAKAWESKEKDRKVISIQIS